MKDKLINKIFEYVDQTKDFFLENTPPLFNEYVRYNIAFYVGVLVICILIYVLFEIKDPEDTVTSEGITAIVHIGAFVLGVMSIWYICSWWFFPKATLLEIILKAKN